MSHHYTESLIGGKDFAWCNRCGRQTEHLIVRHSEHAGRLGHCVDPEHPAPPELSKKQQVDRARREKEKQNPSLF